ncbi:DUF2635 domain-containing protein [uncultured Martelella sp.]|uniref:DUF2635 domain-containing protein n=1 Tax=uncultured Martelella sp. TaxID=392331 RepID=UPI0029C60171|nr:DUF2635 domain-containing protein [uncultured Martelella sp.]
MADLKFVKPGAGLTSVPLPNGDTVTADGLAVANTLFVRRRLKDGDLVEAKRPAATKTTTAEKD